MAIADDKRKAARAVDALYRGQDAQAALVSAANELGTVPPDVFRAVRTVRYLAIERLDLERYGQGRAAAHVARLLDNLPADVVVVPISNNRHDEHARQRFCAALSVSLPALPCVYAWQDAISSTDENGDPVTIPGRWRAIGIRRKREAQDPWEEWAWEPGNPHTDRRLDAKMWAKKAAQPPGPEDLE